MNPRILEIQSEREKERLVIAAALDRLAALDAEYAVVFATLKAEAPPQELTFCDDGEIDWIIGRATFTPATYRLIRELWESETKFISKEELREFVQHDEYSRDGSIRMCVCRVRKEIEKKNLPYILETIKSKGYRLKKASPNVTKKVPNTTKRRDGR